MTDAPMNDAIARLDWGRWLADCPNPECTNAMALEVGQQRWHCRFPLDSVGHAWGGCGVTAGVVWPDNPESIARELAGLPEAKRNWRPEEDADD